MKKLLLDKEFEGVSLLDAFRAALAHSLAGKPRGAQARIAQFAGISTGQLTNIIKGLRPGNEAKRRQIALALGYEYEDFLALGQSLHSKNSKGSKKKPIATKPQTLSSEDAMLMEKVHQILLKRGPKAKALRAFVAAFN